MAAAHWLTRFDPDDGSPYGQVCLCEIGEDHDGAGQPNGLEEEFLEWEESQ